MAARSPEKHLSSKETGAYYTPERLATALVHWAVRHEEDQLLDPACGDGRFVAAHRNSFGIEQDAQAAQAALCRAPNAVIHPGDFFAWAAKTRQRFDCATGNPPFIRYQTFNGAVRQRALALCRGLGVPFSGLAASWAPFLVVTASLLRPGGRLAFVVPAAIGHAPYAAPLLDYFVKHFANLRIVAIRQKLFPRLSEDCWLLFADGFGGAAREIGFTAVEHLQLSDRPLMEVVGKAAQVPVGEWRDTWNRRLRPYLLGKRERSLYQEIATRPDSLRFGMVASAGIGYVSGANNFFHLRPSEAAAWRIPKQFTQPTVRNSRLLPATELTHATLDSWRRADERMLLLRIPKGAKLPAGVSRYLDSEAGRWARAAYKCRQREPWYSVPQVGVPDFFLTYMAGLEPALVRNSASATCTNALHGVYLRNRRLTERLLGAWRSPYARLSCELEGHALGGGLLKLEPREAARIVLPSAQAIAQMPEGEVADAVSTLRKWRHYASEASV